MSLTRDEILNAKDFEVKKINIPEWGGDVFIRPMSGRDRDASEAEIYDTADEKGKVTGKSMYDLRARMASRVICDEQGKLLFSSKDIGILGERSGIALDRIYLEAMEISRVNHEAVEEEKKN